MIEKTQFFLPVVALVFSFMILPSEKVLGKMMAEVECRGTEEKLVYDCKILLIEMKTRKKVEKAEFKVSAEMPSMPGSHNVKPVMALSIGMGLYLVKLNLEMFGEWALKMDFTKPRRDRIVKKMIFGEKGHEMSHDHDEKHKHKLEGMPMKHEDKKDD
jgi:hypothetical protein